MLVIPSRQLYMDGTLVEKPGMVSVYANRKINCNRGLPPMKLDRSLKGPIAVVGYGPSLNATWERLRDFSTIISTSKAHDFLVERGIIPKMHMDLDSRIHKVEFLTKPQKGVQYYLSTHIHPSYVDKLAAADIVPQMFHVAIEKHMKLDPRYPALPPRFDVGVQAAELAYLSGHREQHWFGIEYGCLAGATHAGRHWGVSHPPKSRCLVQMIDGRQFESTKLFFHGILLAEHFLCDRALVRCTIHGDGLLGHFLKDRGRTKVVLKP